MTLVLVHIHMILNEDCTMLSFESPTKGFRLRRFTPRAISREDRRLAGWMKAVYGELNSGSLFLWSAIVCSE